MLARQAWRPLRQQSRRYATSTTRPVPVLPDNSLETFRRDAFEPAVPALLPRRSQASMPAIAKWFVATKAKPKSAAFNMRELANYSPVMVPIEVIHEGQFARIQQSFGFFLEFVTNCGSTWLHMPKPSRRNRTRQSDLSPPSTIAQPDVKMYIAQASLSDFPRRMQAELPTPEIVLQAGKGDVYDSSLWLGQAPTYTPLHRDPNPNLFVQLAGKKVVRLYAPLKGNAVFSKVQEQIGGSASATMRGEEMMQGVEKEALEEEVWGEREGRLDGVWQAELRAGDALFIPKGWWHSVKGVGEGINGSVNWWFR